MSVSTEALCASLFQARAVLEVWRVDSNGVRPHLRLANRRIPEALRARHIAVAGSAGNVTPGLYS
jgi:hypothetical protein